jgi:hypothetical protein
MASGGPKNFHQVNLILVQSGPISWDLFGRALNGVYRRIEVDNGRVKATDLFRHKHLLRHKLVSVASAGSTRRGHFAGSVKAAFRRRARHGMGLA